MRRNNIYPIHERMKVPRSMVVPCERLGFINRAKEIVACLIVLASAVACALAMGIY